MASYIYENHVITAVRGDDFKIIIKPERWLTPTERVELHIMEPNQLFEDGFLTKTFTKENQIPEDQSIIANITHDDTKNLTAGTYYYSIKVFTPSGTTEEVHTLIPSTKLLLVE